MSTNKIDDDDSLPTKSDAIKSTTSRINDMFDSIQDIDFNPVDHMLDSKDIPVNRTKQQKTGPSMDKLYEDAKAVIIAIACNYMLNEELLDNIPKAKVMINEQAQKLADLQFLINECKEMSQKLREFIEDGDISPETFKYHRTYLQDINNHLETRTRYLQVVEKYWQEISEKAGIKSKEEQTVEKESKVQIHESSDTTTNGDNKSGGFKGTTRDLNKFIEDQMNEIKTRNKG